MKDEMNKAQSGERTFDENQKKAITVSRNAVVSAGAGSGKTTVLAERFSYLVTEKRRPDSYAHVYKKGDSRNVGQNL